MSRLQLGLTKAAAFLLCLSPFVLIVVRALGFFGATLGANPVEELLHTMGKTGLNILLITLAVSPLRRLTKLNSLVRFRRMLGLFAFFYLLLHFLTYAVLDLRLAWGTLGVDITQRPYITVGMLALLLMIPLAVTSTSGWQRRLKRRWTTLHRLVYPIVILGVLHFFWQVKLDTTEPLIYAGIATVLLGERLIHRRRTRTRRARAASGSSSTLGEANTP
jgi:sulfoxide reductase heme-binding subunit YedZ